MKEFLIYYLIGFLISLSLHIIPFVNQKNSIINEINKNYTVLYTEGKITLKKCIVYDEKTKKSLDVYFNVLDDNILFKNAHYYKFTIIKK